MRICRSSRSLDSSGDPVRRTPGDDVIDRGAARGVRQAIPAPRAAPVLQFHQLRHERRAVRCPRHNLVVMLPRISLGAERPAALPLPGRHSETRTHRTSQAPQTWVKLTGRSDIAAATGGQCGGPRGGVVRRESDSFPACRAIPGGVMPTDAPSVVQMVWQTLESSDAVGDLRLGGSRANACCFREPSTCTVGRTFARRDARQRVNRRVPALVQRALL